MLDSIKSAKKSIGIKQTTKALLKDEVDYLIIASDAEQNILGEIITISSRKGIKVHYAETMKQLGKAVGIGVGAAVVAILR
jgi:large subunit ribosomal protein L7A